MDDRTPGQRMTYLEALCSLPDSAIILFGGDLVTASSMACVRDPARAFSTRIFAANTTFVQLYDLPEAGMYYHCALCARPFNQHVVQHDCQQL